jgi:hypothetical protein
MLSDVASGYSALQRSASRCYRWSALRSAAVALQASEFLQKRVFPAAQDAMVLKRELKIAKGPQQNCAPNQRANAATAKRSTVNSSTAKHSRGRHNRADGRSKQQAVAVLWYPRPYRSMHIVQQVALASVEFSAPTLRVSALRPSIPSIPWHRNMV